MPVVSFIYILFLFSFLPPFVLVIVRMFSRLSCGLFCRSPLPSAFLRKGAGFLAQESFRLCAKAWAFLRKSVAVLAQGLRSLCAGPCVHALPFLRVRRDACSPVSRRQRCPAVPSLRVRCRGGCALPWLSARRVAAPCGERRGIAPRRAGLSVRPVPFLRKKCGGITDLFP